MSLSDRFYRSIVNTLWLYPIQNIRTILASTTINYSQNGSASVLTFGSIADIDSIATEIYNSTVFSPDFLQGYNVGVGSLLHDTGRRITFCLPGGQVFMIWGEAILLTDQNSLPSGGNAPQGLQGYLTTYLASGNDVGKGYDPVRVVRSG